MLKHPLHPPFKVLNVHVTAYIPCLACPLPEQISSSLWVRYPDLHSEMQIDCAIANLQYSIENCKGLYTKEEGMQLRKRAKFERERLLKIA